MFSKKLAPQEGKMMFSGADLKKLLIPLIIEQTLAITIGIADTVMVTTSGEAAVSGISLVDSVNILLIQFFAALATGGAVISAQYIGFGNIPSARKSAKQLFYSSLFISMIIAGLSLLFYKQLLSVIFGKIDSEVMKHCCTYFVLSAISYPFLSIFNTGAALFRSKGDGKTSMKTSLVMNAINIVGNAILIFVFNLSVLGAGIATLLSRIAGAVIMLILITRKSDSVYIEKILNYKVDFKAIGKILRIGIPNGLESSMFQVGKIVLISLISAMGTASTAANAISNTVTAFSIIPGSAIGLGLVTVVGQCMGAGLSDQAYKYTKRLTLISTISIGAANLLLFIIAPQITGMFNLSTQAFNSAVHIIKCNAIVSTLIWSLAFTMPNALRAAGDVKFTMCVSIFSMWVFRIGLSFFLCNGFGFDVEGVWYAMFADWLFRTIVFTLRIRGAKWRHRKVI